MKPQGNTKKKIIFFVLIFKVLHNRLVITPELLAAFQSSCRELSAAGHFQAHNFALPFYHLSGDGFWHLRTHTGQPVPLTA